jgi:hypothetical protein
MPARFDQAGVALHQLRKRQIAQRELIRLPRSIIRPGSGSALTSHFRTSVNSNPSGENDNCDTLGRSPNPPIRLCVK